MYCPTSHVISRWSSLWLGTKKLKSVEHYARNNLQLQDEFPNPNEVATFYIMRNSHAVRLSHSEAIASTAKTFQTALVANQTVVMGRCSVQSPQHTCPTSGCNCSVFYSMTMHPVRSWQRPSDRNVLQLIYQPVVSCSRISYQCYSIITIQLAPKSCCRKKSAEQSHHHCVLWWLGSRGVHSVLAGKLWEARYKRLKWSTCMSKFHEHEGINNVSKTKNVLPNVVSAILCLLS